MKLLFSCPCPPVILILALVSTLAIHIVAGQATQHENDICNYSQCESETGKCYLHKKCLLKRLDETTNALTYCERKVTDIELAGQGISYLCPHAVSLVSPLTIDLSDNLIADIPQTFFSSATSLASLSSIKLAGNRITRLNRSHFSGMFRLRHLDVSDNTLGVDQDLPEDVFLDLFLLQSLDLSRNFVKRVPNIDKLIFLKCFNVSRNNLTELPEAFLGSANHSFPFLTTLDVSNNAGMYATMPSYLFDEDISSNGSILLQNLNHFHFDEDAIQFSGCNERFALWSNTNCFNEKQAPVLSFEMVTLHVILIAVTGFLVASLFIIALVCLVVRRRKRREYKFSLLDNHSMGYMKVNRNVSSFVEHITPLHDAKEDYPEPYVESATSTQANSRDFRGSQEDHMVAETSSQQSVCIGSSNYNLAREIELRKKLLEQKIRRKKKTHLKQLRSFSCNDIPKPINDRFSL